MIDRHLGFVPVTLASEVSLIISCGAPSFCWRPKDLIWASAIWSARSCAGAVRGEGSPMFTWNGIEAVTHTGYWPATPSWRSRRYELGREH
jgi:hypothetical protein